MRIDARVDVTALVEGEAAVGDALRDFIVQVDGNRLPPHVRELVDRYLRRVASRDGDRSFIAHPVDGFFVADNVNFSRSWTAIPGLRVAGAAIGSPAIPMIWSLGSC